MRIWTLHPKYLDAKGLVALWRETLLAKHVLEGKTKGYTNHPQLFRFKNLDSSLDGINHYLSVVLEEASSRGYNFNKDKIDMGVSKTLIEVTTGQVRYEQKHLLRKLQHRDPNRYEKFKDIPFFEIHPMFKLVEGNVEDWEVQY